MNINLEIITTIRAAVIENDSTPFDESELRSEQCCSKTTWLMASIGTHSLIYNGMGGGGIRMIRNDHFKSFALFSPFQRISDEATQSEDVRGSRILRNCST